MNKSRKLKTQSLRKPIVPPPVRRLPRLDRDGVEQQQPPSPEDNGTRVEQQQQLHTTNGTRVINVRSPPRNPNDGNRPTTANDRDGTGLLAAASSTGDAIAAMEEAGTIREKRGQELTTTRAISQQEYNAFNDCRDRLENPEFLRIDESQFPLNIFDNEVFKENDRTPEEWAASGRTKAEAQYFVNGEWHWRECIVQRYNAEEEKFVIKFIPRGKVKEVQRLNLRFHDEDPDLWQRRKQAAEEAREHTKSMLRLDHYLEQQSMEGMRPIQQVTLRGIHEKVAHGLPKSVPYPQPTTPLGLKLRQLTGDVIHWYTRNSKKSVLYYRMARDPAIREAYDALRLPPPAEDAVAPEMGKVELPQHPFYDRCGFISQMHISSIREVLAVFVWMYSHWDTTVQNQVLMDTVLEGQTFPMHLKDFHRIQNHHCAQTLETLEQEWRRNFVEHFVDNLQDVFDFFQSNEPVFRSGALYRLFKTFELRMHSMLRHTLQSSLTRWSDFVKKHTDRTAAIDVQVPEAVTALVAGGTRATETKFDLFPRCPLFAVQLGLNNEEGTVELQPSVEEVKQVMTGAVDAAVSALRTLRTVEAELMSLLHLESHELLNIAANDPLYRILDDQIAQTKRDVVAWVEEASSGARELASMYQRHAWLMATEKTTFIEEFIGADPAPTHAQWEDKLRELHDAILDVRSMSFESENFPLLSVNTTEATRLLVAKAMLLRDGLLEQLVLQARSENLDVVERYEKILARIAEKPKDEKELADLRDFIDASKSDVESMKARVAEVRRRLATLDEFEYRLPPEDIAVSWSTLGYPSRVDAAAREAEEALEADKVRMMDKLAMEKEKFEAVLERLEQEVTEVYKLADYDKREEITETVNKLQTSILEAKEQAADFNMREHVFGFPPTEYAILDDIEGRLEPFFKLWNMITDFFNSRNDWLHGSFIELDGKSIEEDVTGWWKQSYQLSRLLEEEYEGPSKCAAKLRADTTEFRAHLPVVQSLASKALRERHWHELSDRLGHAIIPDEELTLQSLLDMDAAKHIESIQEVTLAAEKEYNLERTLYNMKTEWEAIEFDVRDYKESGTYVVTGIDDIVQLLDDHIVKTQTMRGQQPYIRPIENDCKLWEYQLKYAQTLLDRWIAVQRTWLYLEPIFGSEDIMRQLPTEARRFNAVDNLWRKTMAETKQEPVFMVQANPDKKLSEKFQTANEKLEEIQKGLSDYLEMKRLYFPRFFFLSNDELLEILSQTKEPRAVQPHLNKCFEGIARVNFMDDLKITEMISAQGEKIVLDRCVDPETADNKGNVERWLLDLEAVQWDSVRTQTEGALEAYKTMSRTDWTLQWPAQVILSVSQTYWTQDMTTALESGRKEALAEYVEVLNSQLHDIVRKVRGKLTKLERSTLGALTTLDVHARDMVVHMVSLGVNSTRDFEWISQMRYCWEPAWKDGQACEKDKDTMVVRIVNAKVLYGYEYLGNTMRLVITPLTDRCYRTMIGAVDLLYGGAPEGPAGTGKTETVKDLSKAVAIQCVVFNCSDGLDYLAMAKFFKGLAGCGSWCCFDEFNRINIEVLSVIAQQILEITNGKRAGKEKFFFEGTHIKLNHNANVFITMNPGYAGRTDLPDNLKALFRPCAMMVPDYALIAEIRLYSFGFENARSNAQKIVRVLQLSSEQLSSQKHYDYGMRAVNSILVAAGNLRQKVGDEPEWTESKLVLRSINDVNLPKFTVEDLPLFAGITSDLFPGEELPEPEYGVLVPCIEQVCAEGVNYAPGRTFKLEPLPKFVNKTIELYEMVLVRHGVMIVGETCSGKTGNIHGLAQAMTMANKQDAPFEAVEIRTMNPKSITSGQLYGNFDENTHEWSDGILAVTFRQCAQADTPARKWIKFDGPVDAVWIENMNTVLDDNKKLCLMSGEIVKMSDTMTMMFEAEDLEAASPATVSRVGMIYCETRNLGWEPVRNIWLQELAVEEAVPHKDFLHDLFDWLFPPTTYFAHKFCKIPTMVTQQEMMFSLLRLMNCLLKFREGAGSDMPRILESCFIMSLVWSVGGCLDSTGRSKFHEYLLALLSDSFAELDEHKDFVIKNRDYVTPDGRKALLVPNFGDGQTFYDYAFDTRTCKWKSWLDGQEKFVIPKGAAFNSIVVPTVDTIRNEWIIDNLLLAGYHVMCTGDTGTGKSVSVKQKLMSGMPDNYQAINLNFSAQTSANQTQDLIDGKLDKRRKGVLGPPLGSVAVVFVDDLNMPAKEVYGAQPPIELLRQWMDHAGWYDRKENEFRQLTDIQFIAAMGPPGGGRTRITQRYVRHFNLINFVPFDDESLKRVFGTILDWFLQSNNFGGSIKQLSKSTVEATVSVYNDISANLLPTPTKSHYTFNLRDLSKVFQGMLQGSSDLIKDKEAFVRLWAHDCMRVFHDRLISDEDRQWFLDALGRITKTSFNLDWNRVCSASDGLILFGNYTNPRAVKKIYQEVTDRDNLVKVMNDYLVDYNAMTTKPMDLVLFMNAIEHVSRISRIINQPYGNALLVGVGGSGRKSVTALAVFIADYEIFQIEISKSYGMFEWREDMKSVMYKAGLENKPTVFLFDDTQIVNEAFLEDINGILNTGEVPNLFNNEELGILAESLGKACQEAGVNAANPNDVYSFFVQRCRTNLHVVLCLSPIGEAFRTRLRMFPSLVNCTTIDWFTEWPEQALRSVAEFFLESVELDESVKGGVVDTCVVMQERVSDLSRKYLKEMRRHYYVTPTSYLELINTFKALLSTQRDQVADLKARYDNGLEKLKDTEAQVADMQEELNALKPQLEAAQVETAELLVQLEKDQEVANEKKVVVEREETICNKQAEEAMALKASCEADLAEALPAYEASVKALKSLSKSDIVEVKSMKKPPAAVKMVMEAVCIMMRVKPDRVKDPEGGTKKVDDYWGPAQKQLLGDTRFLQNLIAYDKDNMDPEIVETVTEYTQDEGFSPELVKKASVAAAGLCKWVHAMIVYDRVARVVAPKREALKGAETDLAAATAALEEKRSELQEVVDKVAILEAGLKEAMDKKQLLEDQYNTCNIKLTRAEQLINGLGGERTRWSELSIVLQQRYDNVTGDILLSAGVIAYLGAFTSGYRDSALSEWSALLQSKGITCNPEFSLRETLGEPVVIRGWVIDKLPNDTFSIENAIMLFHSNRWPLMIDPQGQANKWVKKMEEERQLKVVKQNQNTFVRTLENSIQFGNPVLLENVPEALDPILEPVLLKQVVTVGAMATIRLGDNSVEYDKNFRLYITTKLSNPHYPPELCVKVNLLCFMATAEGLQDQMLGRVVAKEQPRLEAQREQLILEDAKNKKQLKEIEDKILHLLKTAEGNILDDEVLIDTLDDSKRTAKVIEEKVKIAEATQRDIAKVREGYSPVAFQSSQLFFCIADLASVDPMYQYSLEWFIALFETAIDQAEQSTIPDERVASLNSTFTYILYRNVCRSLFEKDKLLFSFLLTMRILLGKKELEPLELRFFLQGTTSMDLAEPNPVPTDTDDGGWLSDAAWGDLLALSELPTMKDFTKTHFVPRLQEDNFWQGVCSSATPLHVLEEEYAEEFTLFQRMCILRCLRLDRVVPAVQRFVADSLGQKFIEPPPFDLQACFDDSQCFTPLVFVLTPGADPMTELLNLAKTLGFGSKLVSISLGQGQGPLAERAIDDAAARGSWVCLQNCHLSISWMPTMEKICEEFSLDTLHPDFRLWLTSEPSKHFPAYILQNGVKMTNEPPKGMRANLLGSYQNITDESLESCARPNEFKKLVFGLCFFHAVVRERRKYGPLGWNIQYVFSGPDLRISMDQLRIFLDTAAPGEAVPYKALSYLAGECNYGGRVTDDKDRRCLMNILSDFYCPSILDDDYRLSPSGVYYVPPVGDVNSYKEYIMQLPLNEDPEVFGLHENANITSAIQETNQLLTTALSLQPRSSGGEGKSWDETLDQLARDIEQRIPPNFDVERALVDYPVMYEQSMNTVLVQELLRFNRLSSRVRSTLVDVQRALKGLVVMSGELEAMGNSMVISAVPDLWSAVAYPSLKPLGSWVSDFLLRLSFLREWMDSMSYPSVYWVSGFFFTQAFLTGTLQNHARKHRMPIDTVAFDFRVLSHSEMKDADDTAPEDGAYIRGLFIQGARYDMDTACLADSRPRELFVLMPYIHLSPKPKTELPDIHGIPEHYTGLTDGTAHVYNCPVYKTSLRQGVLSTTGHSTNFVVMIRLPMLPEHDQKMFIRRGVAMLTQLDT